MHRRPAPRHRARPRRGRRHLVLAAGITAAGAVLATALPGAAAPPTLTFTLEPVARFVGEGGNAAAEIAVLDRATGKLLVTNGARNRVDVFDLTDPSAPPATFPLDAYGADVQSVAVHDGLAAVAVSPATVTDPGSVVFFDVATLTPRGVVTVGALPDMVTFTQQGTTVLVANEGEPRCTAGQTPQQATNPEGSISIIELAGREPRRVRTADFRAFDGQLASLQAAGVRVGTWPGSTVAQDLEPEYITVSKNGRTAYVTLQENNALAVVDVRAARVTAIVPLGVKDHSRPGNELDVNDQQGDRGVFVSAPVDGMYMPDAIADAHIRGRTYLFTANEGDNREYPCFRDVSRASNFTLSPQTPAQLGIGRLDASVFALSRYTGTPPITGNATAPAQYTRLATFGARSFSVWDDRGRLVWDSGSIIDRTVDELDPTGWRAAVSPWATAIHDSRSDNKGSEPEGLAVGKVAGRTLVFVGLERAGGVMVFDATDPTAPTFQSWARQAGDVSPEGVAFVKEEDSPTGRPLVVVSHEISGTTVVYEVVRTRA